MRGNLSGVVSLLWKDIGQTAFQTIHYLLEVPQRDALLALFQPVKGRRRQSDLPGEFGIRHLAALPA